MSIRKRPDGRYRVRWRERPGAPEKSKHFDRKVDAERFETSVRHTIMTGSYVDPNAGRIRLAAYACEWADRQPWRPSSRSRTLSVLTGHVIPRFGDRELRAVRPSDVQSWIGAMAAAGLAPSTVESYYRVLVAVMRSAVVDRLIAETPCRAVKLPRAETSTSALVPLTAEQVHHLADNVPSRLRALVLVSAGLALRQGEACGLTLDRVDFLRRKVTIDRQLVTPGAGPPALAPPKTPASIRSLPLPAFVANVLAEHVRVYLGPNAPGDTLLFTRESGGPIGRSMWAHIFKASAVKAGVDATSHDLRHHAASSLIASGCSVKAVQHFLGHATAAETLDTYGHLWPDDDDRIKASIDRSLGSIADYSRTGISSTT